VTAMKPLLLFTSLWLASGALLGDEERQMPPPSSLYEQLNQLASQYGFTLSGHEQTASQPSVAMEGDAVSIVSRLLKDFNHVLVRSRQGDLERIIIMGLKQHLPPPPDKIVLPTSRRGTHHLVQAVLGGNNGKVMRSDLLIDTGSSYLVLPRSNLTTLDLDSDQMTARQVQTANGPVTASVGKIPFIQLGGETILDVETAFIDDESLGNNALLGMNILGRYQVVLDDQKNTLTLVFRK